MDMRGEHDLRTLRFSTPEKIVDMAERAGVLNDLAAKQGLDLGIRKGEGGFSAKLTLEQFRKLSLGRR